MHTKLLFFDIDGTILSHRNHQISESTINAIRKAKANGHLVFINSGRTLAEIDTRISDVGFDGYVCGCGTYISYHNSVLLHTTLSKSICQMLIEDFSLYHMEVILEGSNAVYYNDKNELHKLMPSKEKLESSFKFKIQSMYQPQIQFDKFCIWCDESEVYQFFFHKYKDQFDFIDRGNNFYEILPIGYSKASGIEFLLSYLNIHHDNTYAFGDGANDLPMLNYVKHSIGMGNSDGGVPEIVSFLTKDVDQDGIEYALKHHKII